MGDASAAGWALGPIMEVMRYLRAHSSSDADLVSVRTGLEAAEPYWRGDPVAYAEPYGLLSDLLCRSYLRSGDAGELDAAVAYFEAVKGIDGPTFVVRTRLRNHGVMLDVVRTKRDRGVEAASACLSRHCGQLREELKSYREPSLLEDLARNANLWGRTAAEDDAWSGAADAYELAARAVGALFRALPSDDRGRILVEFRGIDAAAASALGRVDRWRDAVAVLEASRQRLTRFIRGSVDVYRVLSREDPALLSQFRADHQAWLDAGSAEHRTTSAAAEQQAAEATRAAWDRFVETLDRVRQYPGLENYMIVPNFEAVRKATQGRPITYVSSSEYDTVVILVVDDGIVHAGVNLTLRDLRIAMSDWLQMLDHRVLATEKGRHGTLALLGARVAQFVGPVLRDVLTYPFTHEPREMAWRWGPVTLVISGPLAFMPVHAWSPVVRNAKRENLSIMALSYAPSARQAAVARRVPRPDGSTRTLLSLADPEPRPEGLAPLPCARLEAATVAQSALRRSLLRGPDATADAFLRLAHEHEIIHLACHARTSPGSPLESRIELARGGLTGRRIIDELELDHVALVVLSACRSGQQDPFAPDESLDLGSLFLAAGARAVLANLWPIDDLAAGLFIWRMFDVWDWGRGATLPIAVSHAGLWLKELTVQDLEGFGAKHPGWRGAIRRRTRFLPPDLKRFSEPYYWTAFALTGG